MENIFIGILVIFIWVITWEIFELLMKQVGRFIIYLFGLEQYKEYKLVIGTGSLLIIALLFYVFHELGAEAIELVKDLKLHYNKK